MKTFVPDASIILKWVIGEEGSGEAQAILEGWLGQEHEFILPSLWKFEVGNVLGLKRPKDAATILSLLSDYAFPECELTKPLITSTFTIMNDCRGVTFYDAVYHAVAINQHGDMLTADKAYYEKAKKLGGIRLL